MDSSHKLEAPNNDELKTIEQLGDRSELSAVYPHGKAQWSGELISETERDKRRQHAQDILSFGIRKHFAFIGFALPLPFIFAAFVVAIGVAFLNEKTAPYLVTPAIVSFFLWLWLTFTLYKKVGQLFYMNAVQALPYSIMLLAILTTVGFATYHIAEPIMEPAPFRTTLLISIVVTLTSIVASFFLLRLWTTPLISSGIKVLVIGALFVTLLITGLYFSIF